MTENSEVPVNYAEHSSQYLRLRQSGAQGWSSPDEYDVMLRQVEPLMRSVLHGPKVLEIGSGAGNFSIMLAARGYEMHGFEVSDVAVGWARENALAAGVPPNFFHVDITQRWENPGPFDQIIDGHCLHCIIGEDRAKCLEQIKQALVPGGIFIVVTMCGDVTSDELINRYDPKTRNILAKGKPVRYIGTADAICEEIRIAGFEIDSVAVHPRMNAQDQDDLVLVARRAQPSNST